MATHYRRTNGEIYLASQVSADGNLYRIRINRRTTDVPIHELQPLTVSHYLVRETGEIIPSSRVTPMDHSYYVSDSHDRSRVYMHAALIPAEITPHQIEIVRNQVRGAQIEEIIRTLIRTDGDVIHSVLGLREVIGNENIPTRATFGGLRRGFLVPTQPSVRDNPVPHPQQSLNVELIRSSAGGDRVFVRDIPTDGMEIKAKDLRVNERYCPDLYKSRECPKINLIGTNDQLVNSDSIRRVIRKFPGVTMNSLHDYRMFNETFTFFRAVGAPEDWEDVYGESFATRSHVYAFVQPGHPESMKWYSSEELVQSFLQHEEFVDPGSREKKYFTDLQMNRLLHLTRNLDEVLYETIAPLITGHERIHNRMRALSELPEFQDLLKSVLEVGMWMRGWYGEGSYPLTSGETYKQVDDLGLMRHLNKLRTKLEGEWSQFSQLRLMDRERGWHYTPEDLLYRIKLVEAGEVCIRMTSNVLVETAWYYYDSFYNHRPFELSSLRNIS